MELHVHVCALVKQGASYQSTNTVSPGELLGRCPRTQLDLFKLNTAERVGAKQLR